ncbi:MAG: DUF5658 family protein [Phycisphaerae bacterium]
MAKHTHIPLEAGICRQCGYRTSTVSIGSCPDCGGPVVALALPRAPRLTWLSLPPMRYQTHYIWFVLLSAVDIMLTWIILGLNGVELNPLAADVIGRQGLSGMIGFKFCLVVLVVIMAEVIGRRRDRTGRRLAEWAIALTTIPVATSLYQLLVH